MPKDWREFEKFVARVEGLLAPLGAVVRSPDRVRDLTTKQLREVDASIRYPIGSASVLITIECRKRRDKQDQTWIEQLATKKESIGAAKTIAVSSASLSAPAEDLARRKNIETRTMCSIPNDVICAWISDFKFELYQPRWKLVGLAFVFDDTDYTAPQVSSACECLRGANPAEQLVFMLGTGVLCSANDLIQDVILVKGLDEAGFDLPRDGKGHTRTAVVPYAQGAVTLSSRGIRLPIRQITFKLELMSALVGSSSTGRFGEYRSNTGCVCHAADYSTLIDGREDYEVTLGLRKDLDLRQTAIGITIADRNTGRVYTSGLSPFPPKHLSK